MPTKENNPVAEVRAFFRRKDSPKLSLNFFRILAAICQSSLPQSIKTSGTGGNGLEQGDLKLVGQGHAAQRGGIGIFQQENEESATQKEDHGGGKGHFGVEGKVRKAPQASATDGQLQRAQDVPPYGKAQTAQNDERGGHGVDGWVRGVGAKTVFADNVHTRVAEGGNGIEHRDPDPAGTEFRHEYRHIQERAQAFHGEGSNDHVLEEAGQSRQGIQIEGVLQQNAIRQAHTAVERQQDSCHNGNDTQSARLNEDEDDDLPEQAPGRGGGDRNEAGYAGGGGSGEQGIEVGDGLPIG